MKFTAKQYATALYESLTEAKPSAQDAVIKSFAAILAKNYDKSLLSRIIAQFKKLERTRGGSHEVVVTSARPLEKSVIKDIAARVGTKSPIKEVIDPTVLGGMKVLINDETVIDGTYRTRIARLVESVTRAAQ